MIPGRGGGERVRVKFRIGILVTFFEPYLTWEPGGGVGIRLNEELSLISQDTAHKNCSKYCKDMLQVYFYIFKIVLYVLKFSFVFIRCHGNYFFNLSLNREDKQSHLDSMIALTFALIMTSL